MSQSPPVNSASTSVFNALGSYADRIKDANGNIRPANMSNGSKTPSQAAQSPTPAETSATTSSTRSSGGRSKASEGKKASVPVKEEPASAEVDDGPWETVQTARSKARPERQEEKKSSGSSSRNWRERPGQKEKEKDSQRDEESRSSSGKGAKSAKKLGTSSAATAVSGGPSPAASASTAEPTPVASTLPSAPKAAPAPVATAPKFAWGAANPLTKQSTAQTAVSASTSQPRLESASKPSVTAAAPVTPTSPSLNGSTVANGSTTGPASVASPILTAETPSTSTAVSSPTIKGELEEDGSWRAKSKENGTEKPAKATPAPTPVSTRQTAPPPAVNVWSTRKTAMGQSTSTPSVSSTDPTPSAASRPAVKQTVPAPSAQDATAPLLNGDVKNLQKKKKKATSEPNSAVAAIADPVMWPDVAQAAKAAKEEEEKKEKAAREKKEAEEEPAVEDAPTGRKPKWTAIPADELQAAADLVAEQNRKVAAAQRRIKAESSVPPAKTKARKASIDGRKSQSQSGEIRLPPMPAGSRRNSGGPKPVFGTVGPTSDAGSVIGAPLSRQTSRQSKFGNGSTAVSPRKSRSTLPSPTIQSTPLDPASSSFSPSQGPSASGPSSKPLVGSVTAPILQGQFQANGAGIPPNPMPRTGRMRDARSSFSTGRGRGNFRSQSQHMKGLMSPPMGMNGLPSVDGAYPRGHMGYNYHSNMGHMPQVVGPGQYDAVQVQYMQNYNRGNQGPPAPLPQSYVQGLDMTRFYVLGQVEYYFSMQNLAMDFFLRQQMDSEGWIDISMIASFNRLKSLSPDIALIKEMMMLSSLLEVQEEKVRLTHDHKKWVLPDAKPSTIPPTSPKAVSESAAAQSTSSQMSNGHPLDFDQNSNDYDSQMLSAEISLGLPGLGMEDIHGHGGLPTYKGEYKPGGVENALMKSASVPASSSVSVSNAGDDSMDKSGDGSTVTPATSMSGDKEDEEVKEVKEVKEVEASQ